MPQCVINFWDESNRKGDDWSKYNLPYYETEKLLKFFKIFYGYLLFEKTLWEYKPAIVRLPQSVCKCQIQIPKGGKS